jgi:uncharacterized membrane protein YidH (DUF202 family)
MRTTTVIAILLIALGILALVYPKISYKNRESVMELGPIKATAETRKEIPISPIVGGAAIVSGVVLLLAGSRRRT